MIVAKRPIRTQQWPVEKYWRSFAYRLRKFPQRQPKNAMSQAPSKCLAHLASQEIRERSVGLLFLALFRTLFWQFFLLFRSQHFPECFDDLAVKLGLKLRVFL